MPIPKKIREAHQLTELDGIRTSKASKLLSTPLLLQKMRLPDPSDPTDYELATVTEFRAAFPELKDKFDSYQASPSCKCSSDIRAALNANPEQVQVSLDKIYGTGVYNYVSDPTARATGRQVHNLAGKAYVIGTPLHKTYEALFTDLRAEISTSSITNTYKGVVVIPNGDDTFTVLFH